MALNIGKPSRGRSSTTTSAILSLDEQSSSIAHSLESFGSPGDAHLQIDHAELTRLCKVTYSLFLELDASDTARETFRRGKGFDKLLDTLSKICRSTTANNHILERARLACTLSLLLGRAILGHRGNAKYLHSRLDGWAKVGGLLLNLHRQLISSVVQSIPGDSPPQVPSLYATLLSVALGRDDIGSSIAEALNSSSKSDRQSTSICHVDGSIDHEQITRAIRNDEILYVPQAAASLIRMLLDQSSSERQLPANITHIIEPTLLAISTVIDGNQSNSYALWQTGILSSLLKPFLDGGSIGSSVPFGSLFSALSDFGFNSLDDLALLSRHAEQHDHARGVLYSVLQRSKQAAYINFDLSVSGFSSLEVPSLSRMFPPSNGYSLAAWLRVDEYDPSCHTTIFGAFDASQRCFILAYLERDSHQLILQTSIRSQRPSVRFKSTRFERGRWYHVTIVHRKGSPDPAQSPAMLFVDGDFAEQVKVAYPESPGEVSSAPDLTPPHAPMQRRQQNVQAFFGTPHDLALGYGRNQTTSKWSLAGAQLCSTALSDEFIAVVHRLGPRYTGNWQDCLGPLLTYRASAQLNRYNELLHPEKSEKSDIVAATENRGSAVMPETKLLLSFSPSTVIHLDARYTSTETTHELDRKAHARFQQLAQKTPTIAINNAIPLLNEAITRSFGTALLTGDPAIIMPRALDDASWELAGCLPLMMRLLESATTKRAFLQSVQIFLECVQDNWRISEAMEKGHGFGMLAIMIREKLGYEALNSDTRTASQPLNLEDRQSMPIELLEMILDFVGYDKESPEDSMIVNPMAYRVLLIDFDTWRRCDLVTQSLYYTQFVHFATRNKHQSFNSKRLNRMRITKRFVDAMKGEEIESAAVPLLMKAIKTTLGDNANHHIYRDLGMFVAYGLQDERVASGKSMKSLSSVVSIRSRALSWARGVKGTSRPSTPGGSATIERKPGVPRAELAIGVLELLVDHVCTERSAGPMRRFNRAVSSRFMLPLLSETNPRVLSLTLMLLSHSLRCLGSDFRRPFVENHGGFTLLKSRLKNFWQHDSIWRTAFAILFGKTLSTEEMQQEFSVFTLVETYAIGQKTTVMNPEIMPALMAMLEAGLRSIVKNDPPSDKDTKIVRTVIQFLSEACNRSPAFRQHAASSRYIQDLLFILYPVIVGSDRLSAETELKSDKEALTFKGAEVTLRPHSNSLGERPPSIRSVDSETDKRSPSSRKVQPPKRLSSFELLNNGESNDIHAQFSTPITPKKAPPVKLNVGNSLIEALLEVGINIFLDQICNNSKYNGIGLFLKVPPGFQEHQAYFESYVLIQTLSALWNHLQLNQSLLTGTKVLMNLAKFNQHISEAVFEGWFVDGSQHLLDLSGKLLDYLQQPDIASLKSVRLCSQAINDIRVVFLRVVLLRLSELDEVMQERETTAFLDQMNYWQTILFSSENQETVFIRLICYLLYIKLESEVRSVRLAAARLWRTVLVQKPTETATLMTFAMGSERKHLSTGFMNLVSLNDEDFLAWVDVNKDELHAVFTDALSSPWTVHVESENRKNQDTAQNRLSKRREKLRQWEAEELSAEDVLSRYETSTRHWRSNVHSQERVKLHRAIQDHHESVSHLSSVFRKVHHDISQPCGIEPHQGRVRWQLDETEALNRMRMRVLPDTTTGSEVYQPKRKMSQRKPSMSLAVNTQIPRIIADDLSAMGNPTPTTTNFADAEGGRTRSDSASNSQLLEGSFEMIDDPREEDDGLPEDKNRKILTSLQRGDQVHQLHNISRIIGLEACEGLLIVGKKCLYMQDNYFQRSDGEIVSAGQAPDDERDPYVQLISGKDVGSQRTKHSIGDQETRHWTWAEVLSISKRRFLLRDVAIEVFFTDGRSYLTTLMSSKARDDLYSAIVNRAPHVHSASTVASEDAWRLDTLRNPEEVPQTLGSKFVNVFNAAPTHAATKKWVRGEMSNFQYLMLVNTMAGRTFNDLTQYPVFPWVIADYTSEELDLTDNKTFRDLSKPMGCQNLQRESDYRDRYKQFAEMGDQNAPPFHYGTHYSSAMIVTSYLIRLQPFVQAYLLLQGGNFDHADRLFDSIEKAWFSCSRDNMTDVRELTPEFYYLPEFLLNDNKYDFGEKQGGGGAVNDVKLPPWAKGDPHVFIAKQREALESSYVSENLHKWIDLIFGYKQRGEAAIEATNVFQHLSYQGAKNLDTIQDPVERLATIGIIHSFGQTPHQVFQRSHPAREVEKFAGPRLDVTAQTLTKLPDPLFESDERVAGITFSRVQERLLCSGPGKLNIPPNCDRFVQWGFADHSLRFFSSNTKRPLGLFENTHIGPVSTAVFIDSKTMVTAGADCTLAIWAVNPGRDAVEIQPKSYLFGHRSPITYLTASKVFSTLLSISTDGQVNLWDLNRHDCVRILLPSGSLQTKVAAINNTNGHIVLCTGAELALYTINGHLLLRHQVCENRDESVLSCAFYDGAGNEWLERELIFTGHPRGEVNVWNLATLSDGAWHLQLIKRLNHNDTAREDGANISAGITAVLPTLHAVYTGDEDGRVWEWDTIQRSSSFGMRGR
ncbi:beach-domain-containing protein [Polychaeton citri CBS 116435]|uniref:Beach-domain-containing protein n=1 Tax=Polychaeton citri CBS 116435 TaxID=1314669 RepID=A0A9P4UMC3_9PEZI|nr:beach-domain-containing protein [Polychaeton citri CBS 116435]